MDEIIEEYGGLILGIFAGLTVLGIAAKMVFSDGMLGDLLMELGNMAC